MMNCVVTVGRGRGEEGVWGEEMGGRIGSLVMPPFTTALAEEAMSVHGNV